MPNANFIIVVTGDTNRERRLRVKSSGTVVQVTNVSGSDISDAKLVACFNDTDLDPILECKFRVSTWNNSQTLTSFLKEPEDDEQTVEDIDIQFKGEIGVQE